MLFGDHCGDLEVRRSRSGYRLRGRFPYGKTAVLSDGGRNGRPRKEIIAPKAFRYRIERQDEDIHLLSGHSYDRPLASRGAGSLEIEDTAEAVVFEATIDQRMENVSWVQDILAAVNAGLIVGISPGFRIPPKRAVEQAETVTQEPVEPEKGNHGALIRTVNEALLYELSLVTRPAYPETQVEARSWSINQPVQAMNPLQRWRL
jgi:HK97 family phage prohead protease